MAHWEPLVLALIMNWVSYLFSFYLVASLMVSKRENSRGGGRVGKEKGSIVWPSCCFRTKSNQFVECSQWGRNCCKNEGKRSSACLGCCLRPRSLSGHLAEVSADLRASDCICWVTSNVQIQIEIQIQIQIQIQVWIQIQIQIQLREVSGVRIESLCICLVKFNSTQVHMEIPIHKRNQTKITNTKTSRCCYSYDCITGCPHATV